MPPDVLGSSPRVRGAFHVRVGCCCFRRIIPACAGSILVAQITGLSLADHPRVCGEHASLGSCRCFALGSSPRVRGASVQAKPVHPRAGIIPACAGSIQACSRSGRGNPDHPRVCGEHRCDAFSNEVSVGSSPRVRGASVPRGLRAGRSGIIPACAGSIANQSRRVMPVWDHPRVCGEHQLAFAGLGRTVGSSPRVRGASGGYVARNLFIRIIPACAGSIVTITGTLRLRTDHPRVCGEHSPRCTTPAGSYGSSPRVRGACLPAFDRLEC